MHFVILLLVFLISPLTASAQATFFSMIYEADEASFVMTCPWDSVVSQVEDRDWDIRLEVIVPPDTSAWDAKISVRGRYRRMNCDFPPLELNLRKGDLRRQDLEEFDKIKVVTHCSEESIAGNDLMEELLVYRLYALMTEYAYRAVPVRITYRNPDSTAYDRTHDAVLLEPLREMCARLNVGMLRQFGIAEDSLNAESYLRVALFQFMIGNFDWNLMMERNVRAIGMPGDYHIVPYDFDFSAIVEPHYKRVPAELEFQSFRDRIYLGAYFQDQLPSAIDKYLTYEGAMLALVRDFDNLDRRRRNEITSYLRTFFRHIRKERNSLQYRSILRFQQP